MPDLGNYPLPLQQAHICASCRYWGGRNAQGHKVLMAYPCDYHRMETPHMTPEHGTSGRWTGAGDVCGSWALGQRESMTLNDDDTTPEPESDDPAWDELTALIQELLDSNTSCKAYVILDTLSGGVKGVGMKGLLTKESEERASFKTHGIKLEPSPTAREIQQALDEREYDDD